MYLKTDLVQGWE